MTGPSDSEESASPKVHLPAVIADTFNIPRSEARRRIALGRVKVNGEIVTDLDIDPPDSDPIGIELEHHPTSDAITQILGAQGSQ